MSEEEISEYKHFRMPFEFMLLYSKVYLAIWTGALTHEEGAKIVQPFIDGDAEAYLRHKFEYNKYPQPEDGLQRLRDKIYDILLPNAVQYKQEYDREFNTDWKTLRSIQILE